MSSIPNPFQAIHKPQVGGVDQFWVVAWDDILELPVISGGQLNEALIVLTPGKTWLKGLVIDDSCEYSIEPTITDSGVLFQKSLSGIIPNDANEVSQAFQAMVFQRLLIKVVDHSGVRRLFGSKSEFMRLTDWKYRTQTLSGAKGWSFEFTGAHRNDAFYLDTPALSFSINANGELVYSGQTTESFSINSDGELVVTGAQDDQYSLQSALLLLDTNS